MEALDIAAASAAGKHVDRDADAVLPLASVRG